MDRSAGVKDPAQAEGHDLYKFLEKIIAKLCAALYAANVSAWILV
jgi:hypothetical protein